MFLKNNKIKTKTNKPEPFGVGTKYSLTFVAETYLEVALTFLIPFLFFGRIPLSISSSQK